MEKAAVRMRADRPGLTDKPWPSRGGTLRASLSPASEGALKQMGRRDHMTKQRDTRAT